METLLHVGTEHPNLVVLVVTALLSFVAGIGLVAYRSLAGDDAPAPGSVNEDAE